MQIKATISSYIHQNEKAFVKALTNGFNFNKKLKNNKYWRGYREREHSNMVSGIVNWCSYYEKQYRDSSKT